MWNDARQQTIYQQICNTHTTAKKYLGTALLPFLALFALLTLAAVPVQAATLTSIAVTPANRTIGVGQTQQLSVTGTYSDGTRRAFTGWAGKASMVIPRYGHAVGVVNGILYAVGGYSYGTGGYLASVEAYDPVRNIWYPRAPMHTPRHSHAVAVVGGILYAVGGHLGGPLATVEAYDPVRNIWTTKAPLSSPRRGVAVGVVNGTLYAMGGYDDTFVGGVLQGTLATVEAYDQVRNIWSPRAAMSIPREYFAVGVVNGTLYAVGGEQNFGGSSTSMEAYDPVRNIWSPGAAMSIPRANFAIGVVNGMLYAVGSDFLSSTTAVEAYDPLTKIWTRKPPMSTSRGTVAAGVVNNKLYVVGGYDNGPLKTMEAHTPITWQSSNTSVATIDANGLARGRSLGITTITATSGSNTASTTLTVMALSIAVTPANQTIRGRQTQQFTATATFSNGLKRTLTSGGSTWVGKTAMTTPREGLAAGVINGRLYAVGGDGDSVAASGVPASEAPASVEMYTPATNTWVAKTIVPTHRKNVAVGVVNGILYVIGGSRTYDGVLYASSTVEAYNPATNTWSTKASMLTPRFGHAVGVVNGILYVVGGYSDYDYYHYYNGYHYPALATVQAYDPVKDEWTTKVSMPTPRGWHTVGVVNGKLFAVGGGENRGDSLAAVEAYDPVRDEWTTKASMSTPRKRLAAGVVNGMLYAMGGGNYNTTVEAYNPATNTWATKATMSNRHYNFAAGVVNGILYAVGGLESYGRASATVEAYTPQGDVIWRSSNTNVAIIAENGLVNGWHSGIATITATSGNSSGSTTLNVITDTTAPMISSLSNVIVAATDADGAVVTYTQPTATDNFDPVVTVACTPESGFFFPIGTTPVTCSASDVAGNSASNSFSITVVVDTTAPVLAARSDQTVIVSDASGGIVSYAPPTVTDNVDAIPTVICVPASGSFFPIGATLVTCSATDASGNASNSSSFTVTTVQSRVDLLPTALTASISGSNILVQNSVKNQGLGASSAFAIRYYLSSNTIYDAADRLLCGRSVAGLAAGASSPAIGTISNTCAIPLSLGGSYYVLAVVDAGNVVVETNEANNRLSTLTPLLIGPDLLPLSIGVSKSGSTLTLAYALKNQGTQAAGGFTTSYYLSSDSLYQSTDKFLCSRSLSGLGAGVSNPAAGVATTACIIPSGLTAGAYRVLMRLDSGLTVLEANEGNNVRATAVTVSVP